jgi:hypothetical protein
MEKIFAYNSNQKGYLFHGYQKVEEIIDVVKRLLFL